MRHGKKINHLGRKSAHRKAMLSNMACSLIEHKKITTTLAKAKALRKYVEPLITKSKTDTTHSRRVVFSYLQNKEAVKELFGEVRPKVLERPGGYTRILKLGNRLGDNAEMAFIELVDFSEFDSGSESGGGRKKSRRRRGKKKSSSAPASKKVKQKVEEVVEEVEEIAEDVVEEVAEEVVETAEVVEEAVEEVVEEVAEAEEVVEEAVEDVVEEVAEEVEEVVEEVEEVAEPVVEAVEEVVEEVAETVEEVTAEADDLTKVEGIGPKINELFQNAGIRTFADLAAATEEQLKQILVDAGPRFASKNPGTWPRQAELAAEGKWDELKAWQDELDGGKE